MPLVPFRTFKGEVPRYPPEQLPDGAAQLAVNVDLAHADVRGLRGNAPFTSTPLAAAIKSVYTEDGVNFFAWPYEVYSVRSMANEDIYHRLYYTAMPASGPIIKVARTIRDDGTPVAGGALVGGNFQPPENSFNGMNGTKIDQWLLGCPQPVPLGIPANGDQLAAQLVDKTDYPDVPGMQLRVTYFLEDESGQIVFQTDITNLENGIDPKGVSYPQVWYTNDWTRRGNKIQDMLFIFGWTPRPYKFYWYDPPQVDLAALSRTVTVTNNSTLSNPDVPLNAIAIAYTSSSSTLTPTNSSRGTTPVQRA